MKYVFCLNADKTPMNPIKAGEARHLLKNKKAAVFLNYPFVIILKEQKIQNLIESYRLKIDPGACWTGLAIVNDCTGDVIWAAELRHRGRAMPGLKEGITEKLTARRSIRRGRRARHTRYRAPRFDNRSRINGWLPPSLQSRILNIMTWVTRLKKFCLINAISQELVKFNMALIDNPNIQGKEYQQGELCGYETREYLLEKWNRQCAYCDVNNVPLEIEHIIPRSKNGSNSIRNLTLSCHKCNIKKGTQDIKDFLKKDPNRLANILKRTKMPLKDAAAVNATRWALLNELKKTKLPVECGSGGLTKYNRTSQKINKSHWTDAACVGLSTPKLNIKGVQPLIIAAIGHGNRQLCQTDKYGFPKSHRQNVKKYFGFQTGDIVIANVSKGKHKGVHKGKLTVRKTGSFGITTSQGKKDGINYKNCKVIHKADGYNYQ